MNASNNVELSNLVSNQIDWSNNFLPGISSLISGLHGTGGYGCAPYYKDAPYMLSANTAWLEMNTTKAPMNNVDFRKAVADAVNPQAIVSGSTPASSRPPTRPGCCPTSTPISIVPW